ncbi:MAG: oligoendopeptidase F [Gammaproteobacteria bacterium]|nr:oligoendopeptidase F [Gammaproteobacteria bacterium]
MIMKLKCLFLVTAFCFSPVIFAKSDYDRWDLSVIYKDAKAWGQAADRFEKDLVVLEKCKGKLGSSAATLKRCLGTMENLAKENARLNSYASMLYDENTREPVSLELDQRGKLLATKFGQHSSFVRPELLSVGKQKLDRLVRQDKGLAVYKHMIDSILLAAPHTLGKKEEALLADTGLLSGAPRNMYSVFANADMQWPTVKLEDGSSARLDQAGYGRYRGALNRDDRKKVFNSFWSKWKEYERTFGMSYYSQVQRDYFYSKVRNYPNSLASAIGANNIPEAVYRTLVKEVNANLDTLHRYFRLRARMLGIDKMHYYDIYPPMVKSDKRFGIEEGKQLVLKSLAPLGDEVVDVVRTGFENRWMDVYPQPGKRSGAYMNGRVYDLHPFVLMNYNEDYDAVSTLAHEWGHAIHSYLSNSNQSFINSRYAIFNAEVASTLNEALLLDYMLKNTTSDEDRLFYLGSALEQLRGTFFRQTMFAEFELKAHEVVENGEPLSGKRLTQIYGDLLKRYHGHDKGVVHIDDLYTVEWAYIPHFYMNFYVYQYATSISASSLIADDIMAGKPGVLDRYMTLLKAGGSDYPYELLKTAGVDLASPEPYRALIKRMNDIMDQIEAILKKRE